MNNKFETKQLKTQSYNSEGDERRGNMNRDKNKHSTYYFSIISYSVFIFS